MTALERGEAARLGDLETTIERGQETFIEVGEALQEIRDARLYRADHSTFEDYCLARWGIGRNYANKQIQASGVVRELGTDVPKPANEAQARELTRLSSSTAQRNAWREAIGRAQEEKRRLTTADVRAAVEARRPAPQSKPRAVSDGNEDERVQTAPRSEPSSRAQRSPVETTEAFVASCGRLPGCLERLDAEAAARAKPDDVDDWLTAFNEARDAIDMLIERTQAAARETPSDSERAEAQVEADRLGIELR